VLLEVLDGRVQLEAAGAGGVTITVVPVPVLPVAPVSPVLPVLPVLPVEPVAPVFPVAPVAPAGPGTAMGTTVGFLSHAARVSVASSSEANREVCFMGSRFD
jgi:hypothetical protein